jgi:hypothetical protein
MINIKFIGRDFEIVDLANRLWDSADEVVVSEYWSGKPAPAARHFEARLLWSETSLYVRFDAEQAEPLVVSRSPTLSEKTLGLWERDVCEIFVAPDRSERGRYFEFEVAPTGEWVDLAIDLSSGERVTTLEYTSGLAAAAKMESGRVVSALKIPWPPFGGRPAAGDVWLGNLFRCVGEGPARGYLAWHPTMTETPNFHVPEKFGELVFVE